MILLQMSIVLLIIFLTICSAVSTVPPAYHSKNDKTKNHLKYEYGYQIGGPSGGQIREERRDGAYALGRYYVLGGDANQKVEYLADNWGFHPYVEYSNIGPHSKSTTQIAYGEEAVKILQNNRLNKNVLDKNKLQQTTLKLHRVPFEAAQQQKKTSKPLKVVPSLPPKPTEQSEIALQPLPTQYYPSRPQEVPHYILEPPPQPQTQSNQIPVYFIQSGYSNPHQQNYLYPPPENTVQTTILVPVKSHVQQEYYQPPPQTYFSNAIQPSALPLIYEPPPTQAIVPLHQSIVLENIQDNIKNQLLEEQDRQRQRTQNLYGSKITTKLTVKPPSNNKKLIESTRELVTAQDVININESLEDHYYVTTPKSPRLSENPIVVQDLADSSNEQYSSTTQKVEVNIASSEPTILVTPRPQLSSNHLAPINAAIQLQSVESPQEVPPKKQNVVVEIQKSVPYYLGKFEFVQDKHMAPGASGDANSKYKYDISAETAENFELGKSILDNFGGTAAVSSTKEPFVDQTNNLDQHQESGQIEYQVLPAQSLIRNLPTIALQPSPTVLVPMLEQETTMCEHQYHSGVTHLMKVPDTTKPVTNDVFPTSKPLGTILESYAYNNNPYKQQQEFATALSYKTIDLQGSASLMPPMPGQVLAPYYRPHRGVYPPPVHHYGAAPKKYRHARQSYGGNFRIEYGFMPPLIPSVEIDEHGKPIEKSDS